LVTLGKALSGGFYPISAVIGKKNIMKELIDYDEGDVYCGNPLASKIMKTALQVIVEEKMVENSVIMGDLLSSKLK